MVNRRECDSGFCRGDEGFQSIVIVEEEGRYLVKSDCSMICVVGRDDLGLRGESISCLEWLP